MACPFNATCANRNAARAMTSWRATACPLSGFIAISYGIQPKPNRLYLEPHLTAELNGTELRYQLRGQLYVIDLSTEGCAVTAGACTLRDAAPFGVNATDTGLEYFPGKSAALGVVGHAAAAPTL